MVVLLFDPERFPGELVDVKRCSLSEYADMIGCDRLEAVLTQIGGRNYLVMAGLYELEQQRKMRVSAVNESFFPRMVGKLLVCNYDVSSKIEKTLLKEDVERIGGRIARVIDNSSGEQTGGAVILDGWSEYRN